MKEYELYRKLHNKQNISFYFKFQYEFYKVSPNMRKGFEYNVICEWRFLVLRCDEGRETLYEV